MLNVKHIMVNNKIIPIKKYQKKPKMLFLILTFSAILALILWHYFVDNVVDLDVQIPQSHNITFNTKESLPVTTVQIANEFEKAEGKPILLYIYTTWCKVCSRNLPMINEISREFQNTDLKVLTLAVDRNLDSTSLKQYLNGFNNIYFQPRFLSFKDGFLEFLRKKNIRYNGRIPFTALISREGRVVARFTGKKSKNFLRNKIIKELYK